ncbi:MAG: cation:proton antiporter [Cytophagaceae bacterium]
MIPLIQDIIIVLGLAVLVILVFQKLNIPTILGFLFTGTIAGPHGLSLIKVSHEVELLAEIGVILLLFIIGIEFSLKKFFSMQRIVLLGGTIQVFITIGIIAGIVYLSGLPAGTSTFVGFLIALSSTAIVMKLIQEKNLMNSPHGKASLGILIFQDIIVVPMMLFTPYLTGESQAMGWNLLLLSLKVILIILFVIVAARYVVPRLLYQVAKTKSRELFLLSIVVICFSVAGLTSYMELSLALGAFLAGLIISESEYSHQATGNILPFRELFTSFFFISIGMLLDLNFLIKHFHYVILISLSVIVIKLLIASFAGYVLKFSARSSILLGVALAQVGEFAFILSETGLHYNLLTEEVYQYFLSVSIITMAATPFLVNYDIKIYEFVNKIFLPDKLVQRMERLKKYTHQKGIDALNDHLVIIGYGVNGQNVAKAAKSSGIPYVILEMNADTVRAEKAKGEPIIFGDAVQPVILSHVSIHKARVAVIAVSDPVATKQIIVNIRMENKKIQIIVRTRFVQEMESLFRLGADEVIPEEFETSIEIFTRVLSRYLVPQQEIERFTHSIRSDNYEMLRFLNDKNQKNRHFPIHIPDIDIATIRIEKNVPQITGKTIIESNIRNLFGVTVIAIKRDNKYLTPISPDTLILEKDHVYVLGKPDDIFKFSEKFKD